MAEADNYWDATKGVWIDGATGNYMKPTDAGGDGVWYSPDGQQRYVNGVWSPASTQVASSRDSSSGSPGPGASGTVLGGNPGYQYDIAALNSSTTLENTDRNNAAAMAQQQADQAWQADQARITQDFTAKQSELNRQFTAQQNASNEALQRELQAGRLDADKYMQAKALAQQEAEFSRNLALQTLTADRDFQLKSAGEAREERLLRAQLAANPEDTVAYEFYKRGGATPEAWNMAQQFAQAGGTATAAADPTATGSGQFNPAPLSGNPYPADNPAYSDSTLQSLVSGFYDAGGQGGEGGPQALYNPRLSGTGAFGAQIQGPQAISRAKGQRMTDDEMGVLTSFLNAGVDVGGGKRVSIDPNEYFKQVEQSWIPTLSGSASGGRTEYR